MKKDIKGVNKEDMKEVIELGRKIKAIRIRKGYSSAESFTRTHGIERSLYLRLENGCDVNFSSLAKVVKALDIPFSELFRNEGKI